MPLSRKIEIFSAGCPVCDDVADQVREAACQSCDIEIVDMQSEAGAARAKVIGVSAVPAVAIDGKLAACCQGQFDIQELRDAGLGKPMG